jgi:hypothetical protein
MALNAKTIKGPNAPKNTLKPIDAGTYPVRLVQVLDMGIQEQQPFQGKAKPPAQEVMLTYEFNDEFVKDENGNDQTDKPRWLSETVPLFNLSADKAKSTQRYYALDPQESCGGDFTRLVGMPCLITVAQKPSGDKIFNNIHSASAVRPRDAERMAPLVNQPKVFLIDDPDMEIFYSLPEWVQEKIKKNLNYQGSALQKLLRGPVVPPSERTKPVVEEPEEDQAESDTGASDGQW